MATTFVKIQTVTVGSGGAANIEFTSIPQTYTDLKLVYSLRETSTGVNTTLTFNGSSSNFSWRQLAGDGTSPYSNNGSSNLYLGPMTNATQNTASVFSNGDVYIPNYKSSNNKSFFIDGVTENNATQAFTTLWIGLWSNTAAITSISFAPSDAGNFAQYSTATLYGIKNT